VRTALVAIVVALALPAAAVAKGTLDVSFTGAATGHLVDVQRWILLDENECYLRKSIDQSATLSWTLGWRVPLGGGVGTPVGAPSVQGTLSGTEVGDLCGEEETRPEDVPENWIHSLQCGDVLTAGPGSLTATTRAGNLILSASGPQYDLPAGAICSLRPRSTELQARVVIPLKKLPPGKTMRIAVGSAFGRWGSYVPHLNCMHAAKPYDGYRSFDECGDDLSWSGAIVVSRLRT
jgi:hypothetical protein